MTDGGLDGAVENIRSALESGIGGETRQLLRLPFVLPEGVPPFASVAAVALEMASEAEVELAGEELARLASDLMEVERRSRGSQPQLPRADGLLSPTLVPRTRHVMTARQIGCRIQGSGYRAHPFTLGKGMVAPQIANL